jgi:hypothetical protein
LFMADQMNENLFCSLHRKELRRHLGWIDEVVILVTIFFCSRGNKWRASASHLDG